jgi:hypothetical protein
MSSLHIPPYLPTRPPRMSRSSSLPGLTLNWFNFMSRTKNIFVLLCVMLIGTFLWRAFTPSHEVPSQGLSLFNIVLDVVSLIAVILCWIGSPQDFRASAGMRVLCIAAVVAGIGCSPSGYITNIVGRPDTIIIGSSRGKSTESHRCFANRTD